MARLFSGLSPDMLHALGWALIHSLWQGAAIAALAASVMALSRAPRFRYLVAIGALILALAAPVATFIHLAAAPVAAALPAAAAPMTVNAAPVAPMAPRVSGQVLRQAPAAIVQELSASRLLSPGPLAWLVGAWLCGVLFFSLHFAAGFLLLEHRCRKRSMAPATRILALCRQVQQQLGVTRAVRYLECAWLQTPAVIGWLRPTILLPLFALTGLSEDQFKAVIAHELAHIRRHDWLVNLFQIAAQTLLFHHPAIWWLNRRIRAERELCCDEIAVSVTGNRLDYARALTILAELESAPALAMAANRGPLSGRILHILGRGTPGAGRRMLGLTGSALFLIAALGAGNALFGIAYPVPAAVAKAIVKPVPPSQRPATGSRVASAEPTLAAQPAAPAQPAKIIEAATLAPPAPDLSRLLPPRTLAAPLVVASNILPTAAPPVPVPSPEPATVYQCRNSSVFGWVYSDKAIQVQGFTCLLESGTPSARDLSFGGCPMASTTTAHKDGCEWDVALNVRLADPGDAGRMQKGRLVRLGGDFRVTRRGQKDYLTVENAKILFVDYFRGRPPAALICRPPELVALSRKAGSNICVQREILDTLKDKASALETAALSPDASRLAKDAGAIVCIGSDRGAAARLNCAYNGYWSTLAVNINQTPHLGWTGTPPFYNGGIGGGNGFGGGGGGDPGIGAGTPPVYGPGTPVGL